MPRDTSRHARRQGGGSAGNPLEHEFRQIADLAHEAWLAVRRGHGGEACCHLVDIRSAARAAANRLNAAPEAGR